MPDNQFKTYMVFGLHAAMAYAAVQSKMMAMVWGVAVLVIGVYQILRNNNANNEAANYAAYWTGMELLLRMTRGNLTYESGKYGVIAILLIGLIAEDRPFKMPRQFLIFFLLLLPALTVVEFTDFTRGRKDILFNISGPLSLIAAAFYFYERKFSKKEINNLLFYFVLPVFAVAVVLFFKTPDLDEVTFSLNSNRKLSGGFGANQVSTMLGLGIFIVGISMFMGLKITGNKLLDIGLIVLFGIRGLLTFSRGGIIASAGALFIAIFIIAVKSHNPQLIKKMVVSAFLVTIIGALVFNYTDQLTGGFLKKRYTNESNKPGKKRDFTTGRLNILLAEMELLAEYPVLGAGVGMSKYERAAGGHKKIASHTEFSRLLAEHGGYGVVALIILVFSPMIYFFKTNDATKPLVAAFTILCFLTMTHGAMRLAMPGFLYGLIFIYLVPDQDDSIHRE